MLKKIILTFITSVIIIGVTGLIGYKLLNKKVEGTETQINSPKVETQKTEETTNAPKTDDSVKQESNTPVKAKTVTTPQVTPTPAAVAVCDELQKRIYAQTFTVNFNNAKAEMKRLTDEVFAKKDYDTQEAELNKITNDFIDKTNLYYSQYVQNMKSINCPAEQLLELKQWL